MISNALSLMIAIPLLGAVISFFAGSKAKFVALLASLVPLYLSLQMYMEFDKTSKIMQFVESYDWVPSIGVKYTLGVDGIGFPRVVHVQDQADFDAPLHGLDQGIAQVL